MLSKVICDKSTVENAYLCAKGKIALIYSSVMQLEDAYRFGSQKQQHDKLKNFKEYKQIFKKHIDNSGFTLYQKVSLYLQLKDVCLKILSHHQDYYKLFPVIYDKTKHYLVRIIEQIDLIEEQIHELEEIRKTIALKKKHLMELLMLRHQNKLVSQGLDSIVNVVNRQIKALENRLEVRK